MNYQKRRKQSLHILKKRSIDAFLVTDFYNIFYLTGFKTLVPEEKEAKLVITTHNIYFITDSRYQCEALEYFQDTDVHVCIQSHEKNFIKILTEIISENNVIKLGFEGHDLTVSWFEYVQKSFKRVELVSQKNLIMEMRNIKDSKEIELMKKAADLSDQCLKEILGLFRVGVSEREIVYKMENWIRDQNVSFSFAPIVAFNEHSALPHYNNKMSDLVLKNNSIVLIDMGITYHDYCSDITRMFFIGNPSAEQSKAYNDLLNVQKRTIEKIQLAEKLEGIDDFARSELLKKGYPSIPHSTGHSVGIEIHESLRVAKGSTDIVQESMVFTIEPGIYYQGKWGMRIEDTVLIHKGKVEILTKFDKALNINPKRSRKLYL